MAVPEHISRYRREGDAVLIEIIVDTVRQLYATLDPAPFRDKDLDSDAETYIVASAREFPLSTPLRLVIHLPPDQIAAADAANIARSVHGYFDYRLWATRAELATLIRNGWISLAIGLSFLFVCITIREVFFADRSETLMRIVAESLLIFGWVAMWHPLQIFLYG